jgi:cobalt-zinc-cadmium efflux system membrane fusion protein
MSAIKYREYRHSSIVLLTTLLMLSLACGSGEDRPESQSVSENHGHAEEHASEGPSDEYVILAADELSEFGIEVSTAGSGELRLEKSYPGEVKVNQDRHAHVVPRVAGIVRAVYKSLGDEVRAGEAMAVLDSRELADAKADYLADLERLELAQSNFDREERLFKKEISSEQEYLGARQALAEARIELRSANQKLRALGFAETYIQNLPNEPEASLIRYPLAAPIRGTIVEKHITQGEALQADAQTFEIADLSTVWVDLSIYQKDMGLVQRGQEVAIRSGQHSERGEITYVRPIVGEDTRTALARIMLPNPDGRWKPGMFVTGTVSVNATRVDVVIPRSAVQYLDGEPVVFVWTPAGFLPRPVVIGGEDSDQLALTSGLSPGEEYASSGSFALKAELQKGELTGGHAH